MPKYIPPEVQSHVISRYEEDRARLGVEWGRCFCGCGKAARLAPGSSLSKDQLRLFPRRFVLGHRVTPNPVGYKVDSVSGCWVWQGCIGSSGYGLKKVNGRMMPAHRYYYELHREAIPSGLQPDHLCKNTICVNPAHIEIVTPAENCRRRDTTKLTEENVREARERYANGRESIRSMARRFGISHSTLEEAIHGQTWRNI